MAAASASLRQAAVGLLLLALAAVPASAGPTGQGEDPIDALFDEATDDAAAADSIAQSLGFDSVADFVSTIPSPTLPAPTLGGR